MSKLYKVLNKRDCAEMGIRYSPTERIILAEHNSGHYTMTRYASPFGKLCIILLLLYYGMWGTVFILVCVIVLALSMIHLRCATGARSGEKTINTLVI